MSCNNTKRPQTVIIFSHEASTRSGAGYIFGNSKLVANRSSLNFGTYKVKHPSIELEASEKALSPTHQRIVPDAFVHLPKDQGKSSHFPLSEVTVDKRAHHGSIIRTIQLIVPTAPDTEQLPIATEVDSNKCHVASDIGGLNDRPTGGQTTGCPLAILTMVHLKIWHPFSRPMKRWSRVLKIQS
ncbi:hypothetical protein T4D_13996 [Trichinella pseudospiralis]|uniref:Uncharacterized protein n=1 Tax=Trichinella pseudospiralis TaxID=6337 RepID=A0A0V1FVB2_TRIPS|nr:hypothetical protein T4D_13996 [Trichinella pseudospiralis]